MFANRGTKKKSLSYVNEKLRKLARFCEILRQLYDAPQGCHRVMPKKKDARGGIHVIWLDVDNSGRTIRYAWSADNGNSWTDSGALVSSLPNSQYPHIAVYSDNIYVVFHERRERAIYMLIGRNPGNSWEVPLRIDKGESQPLHPDVAVNRDGIHVVYIASDAIFYQRSRNRLSWNSDAYLQLSEGTEGAGDLPTIAATDDDIFVVYESYSDRSVKFVYSPDGGTKWSLPQPILTGADYDKPKIAVRPDEEQLHVIAGSNGHYTRTPGPNYHPLFGFTQPSVPVTISSGESYTVKWETSDPDGDPVEVDLYRDDDTDFSSKVPIKKGIPKDSYYDVPIKDWPNGTYYFCGVARDKWGAESEREYSHPVTIDINHPPDIEVTQPDSKISAINSYTIRWSATDPDIEDTIRVKIYYDTDTDPSQRILIAALDAEQSNTGSYVWDMTGIPNGEYFIWVVVYDSHDLSAEDYSKGALIVNRISFILRQGRCKW